MTTQNRRPVLRCVLSNAAHPEYGQVTIPFPIPGMEYERTLECLAAMELGAPLKRDCRVDELESGFPILKRLEKVGANLDELDYLARRAPLYPGRPGLRAHRGVVPDLVSLPRRGRPYHL